MSSAPRAVDSSVCKKRRVHCTWGYFYFHSLKIWWHFSIIRSINRSIKKYFIYITYIGELIFRIKKQQKANLLNLFINNFIIMIIDKSKLRYSKVLPWILSVEDTKFNSALTWISRLLEIKNNIYWIKYVIEKKEWLLQVTPYISSNSQVWLNWYKEFLISLYEEKILFKDDVTILPNENYWKLIKIWLKEPYVFNIKSPSNVAKNDFSSSRHLIYSIIDNLSYILKKWDKVEIDTYFRWTSRPNEILKTFLHEKKKLLLSEQDKNELDWSYNTKTPYFEFILQVKITSTENENDIIKVIELCLAEYTNKFNSLEIQKSPFSFFRNKMQANHLLSAGIWFPINDMRYWEMTKTKPILIWNDLHRQWAIVPTNLLDIPVNRPNERKNELYRIIKNDTIIWKGIKDYSNNHEIIKYLPDKLVNSFLLAIAQSWWWKSALISNKALSEMTSNIESITSNIRNCKLNIDQIKESKSLVFSLIDPPGSLSFDIYVKLFDYIETYELWEYVDLNYFVKDKEQFISSTRETIQKIENQFLKSKKQISLPWWDITRLSEKLKFNDPYNKFQKNIKTFKLNLLNENIHEFIPLEWNELVDKIKEYEEFILTNITACFPSASSFWDKNTLIIKELISLYLWFNIILAKTKSGKVFKTLSDLYNDLNLLKNKDEQNINDMIALILENINNKDELIYFSAKENEINSFKKSVRNDEEYINSTINKLRIFSSMENNFNQTSKSLKSYFQYNNDYERIKINFFDFGMFDDKEQSIIWAMLLNSTYYLSQKKKIGWNVFHKLYLDEANMILDNEELLKRVCRAFNTLRKFDVSLNFLGQSVLQKWMKNLLNDAWTIIIWKVNNEEAEGFSREINWILWRNAIETSDIVNLNQWEFFIIFKFKTSNSCFLAKSIFLDDYLKW